MKFFEAHEALFEHGFRLVGSRLNSGVIFNFYRNGESSCVMLVDRWTLDVEIVDTNMGYAISEFKR